MSQPLTQMIEVGTGVLHWSTVLLLSLLKCCPISPSWKYHLRIKQMCLNIDTMILDTMIIILYVYFAIIWNSSISNHKHINSSIPFDNCKMKRAFNSVNFKKSISSNHNKMILSRENCFLVKPLITFWVNLCYPMNSIK